MYAHDLPGLFMNIGKSRLATCQTVDRFFRLLLTLIDPETSPIWGNEMTYDVGVEANLDFMYQSGRAALVAQLDRAGAS